MKIRVNKWGTGLGIRIPRKLASDARIREGVTVDVSLRDGVLAIERPRFTLAELVEGISTDNRHPETAWGRPAGNEVW
jgi:antitoxin MazE